MVSVSPIAAAFLYSFFDFTPSSPKSSASPSFLSDDSAEDFDLRSAILAAKVLGSAVSEVFTPRTTASARNGGRRTELSDAQPLSFFERARLSTAAWRRTSVTRSKILLLALTNVSLELMKTTSRNYRDNARHKTVTVYLRELFPSDM